MLDPPQASPGASIIYMYTRSAKHGWHICMWYDIIMWCVFLCRCKLDAAWVHNCGTVSWYRVDGDFTGRHMHFMDILIQCSAKADRDINRHTMHTNTGKRSTHAGGEPFWEISAKQSLVQYTHLSVVQTNCLHNTASHTHTCPPTPPHAPI